MKSYAVESKGLSIGYRDSKKELSILYNDLNFRLAKGELTTLMGVNGSGKSTLIKTICGILDPLAGDISIDGISIKSLSKPELSKKLSIVLTERVADGGLRVYDVISLGRYAYTGYFGELGANDKMIIEQAIDEVGISHLTDRYISNLSDGERQKVMIAKSLCQMTDIIVLDEPAAFLDISSRVEIMMLLRKLAATQNRAILVSSHDLDLSIRYSDNIWVLSKNDTLYSGTTEDILNEGTIQRVVPPSSDLLFVNKLCCFVPKTNPAALKIDLVGSELNLIRNAIYREGWNVESGADIVITMNSKSDITLTINDKKYIYTTIKETIKKLKEYDTN